jgi:hypothetical protein
LVPALRAGRAATGDGPSGDPTGQTLVAQQIDTGSGDTYRTQGTTAATTGAGQTVRLNDTAPTGDHWEPGRRGGAVGWRHPDTDTDSHRSDPDSHHPDSDSDDSHTDADADADPNSDDSHTDADPNSDAHADRRRIPRRRRSA